METVLTLLLSAFLNRLRGGGWFADALPSRALFWVTGAFFGLAVVWFSLADAFVFALAYLVWGFLAWGRWFDLNHMPELTRAPNAFERTVNAVSGGNDYIALTIRMAIASPVLAWFSVVLAVVFPFLVVGIYHFCWKVWPNNPIPKAELIVGLLWGLILVS